MFPVELPISVLGKHGNYFHLRVRLEWNRNYVDHRDVTNYKGSQTRVGAFIEVLVRIDFNRLYRKFNKRRKYFDWKFDAVIYSMAFIALSFVLLFSWFRVPLESMLREWIA